MRRHRIRCAGPFPDPGGLVVLGPDESRHLIAVCRHPRGAPIVLFDGEGQEADGVLEGVLPQRTGPDLASIRLISAIRATPAPVARHLVLGLPKGPALDHALRMAVELGVTHIHPATTERTVPNRDHGPRWGRIVSAAAVQSGRDHVPSIAPLLPLARAIEPIGGDVARYVAIVGAPPRPAAAGPFAIAIGPEGGLSERECSALVGGGWTPVGLGGHTLRVDTAVAVGLAALGGVALSGP